MAVPDDVPVNPDLPDVWARQLEFVPPERIVPHPRNPNEGDVESIMAVIRQVGYVDPIIIQTSTGFALAGNHRREAVMRLGMPVVPVIYVDMDDDTAMRYMLGNNETGRRATYNIPLLAELLSELDVSPLGLAGTAFTPLQLDVFKSDILDRDATTELKGLRKEGRVKATPNVDLIYTFRPTDASTFLAARMGILIGVHSGTGKQILGQRERWEWAFPIEFVDNEYVDYDHGLHRDVVAEIRPRYCTVRDYMSPGQCDQAGIAYYDLDQILTWADDLAQYADNVIVIPKVDMLDEIPERFMLGYSVRSSYGATPVPAERFAGRRVHLLGGRWVDQLAYMGLLGDAVVSADLNIINKAALWGNWIDGEGKQRDLRDIGCENVASTYYIALALSLGHLAHAVGRTIEPPAEATEGLDDDDDYDNPAAAD